MRQGLNGYLAAALAMATASAAYTSSYTAPPRRQRGKPEVKPLETRMTDEHRAWNDAVDKRKIDKARRAQKAPKREDHD